jgi:hypothetical protein
MINFCSVVSNTSLPSIAAGLAAVVYKGRSMLSPDFIDPNRCVDTDAADPIVTVFEPFDIAPKPITTALLSLAVNDFESFPIKTQLELPVLGDTPSSI